MPSSAVRSHPVNNKKIPVRLWQPIVQMQKLHWPTKNCLLICNQINRFRRKTFLDLHIFLYIQRKILLKNNPLGGWLKRRATKAKPNRPRAKPIDDLCI